jgi:alpha-L-fucosidase 2
MSKFAQNLVPHPFQYGAMPLAQRLKTLPERNVCSLYPGKNFSEALYTGNGRQRIDVLGDPYRDELAFMHEMLYEPVWDKAPEPPDLTAVLPEVRRLLREGKFLEAADLVEKAQLESGVGSYLRTTPTGVVMPPWPPDKTDAFRLSIQQPECGETKNYLRWLDLLTGKITVQWENESGAFKREAIASVKGDVNALRFTPPAPGALDVEIVLALPIGGFSGFKQPHKCTSKISVDDDLITLELAYFPDFGRKGYVSVIRFVQRGGKAEAIENGVRITGADSLVLLLKTVKFESSFEFGLSKAVVSDVLALSADFDSLVAGNRESIGSRMERSRIRLGGKDDFALSGEELLQRTHTDVEFDPTLLDKLYDMGRFYLIIDTGELPPFWGQHNINTNLQVCSGNNTGLFDEMDVYFQYYESKFEAFRINAKKLFGARGLLASVHCDYDSGLFYHFSKTYPHYCWTGTLGWIYNELWNYYLISGDMEFLRNRIVPALKEIALFFEDYACDRGPDGRVIFYPSFSPENPTPEYATRNGVYATSVNSVMDIMICREVLDNLMQACNTLGIEQENIAHWQAQKASLPRYLLDSEGGLKEWAWDGVNENYNHRHVSHHYDVWPGHVVTWEDEPELAKAILISNRKRGQQDDSAHGIIHRLFTAIRLKDISETVQNLYQLMNHGFVNRTLGTNHYPYFLNCPDLQGAMPAILLEMAVYSAPGVVEFLPAMPQSLGQGSIEGVWLFTWAKLERMDWDEKGLKAKLSSNKAQTLTLRCRRSISSLCVNGKAIQPDGDHIQVSIAKDEAMEIEIAF